MKKNVWFKRFIALTMTGAIMAGSMTALAADVKNAQAVTVYDEDDDEDDEHHDDAWRIEHYPQTSKPPVIKKVANDPNGIRIYTDILDPDEWAPSIIYYNIYCSTNGGKYKLLEKSTGSWVDKDEYVSLYHYKFSNRETPVKNGNFYQYKVAVTWNGEEVQVSKPTEKIYYLNFIDVPELQSLNSGKTLKISWKRNSKADGYKIRYTTSSFKNSSSIKRVTVKGKRNTTFTLKNCTPDTQYKVQVRSYKKINGKTYYSAWSNHQSCYMQ